MQLSLFVLSFGAAWFTWKILTKLLQRSPLDNLPGPPRSSWFAGNMGDVVNRLGWDFVNELDKYGGVSKIHGMFGGRVLHVFDPAALHHIFLKDASAFEVPAFFLAGLNLVFGPGLGATYGDAHRKQRKLLAPVFSTEQMRHLTPVFFNVAHKLRDAILAEVHDKPKELNVYDLTSRTALEIIGQGGLGYSFDPLTRVVSNPFADAVKSLVPASFKIGPVRFLAPWFKYLGSRSFRRKLVKIAPMPALREFSEIINIMHSKSKEILEGKKKALAAGDSAVVEQIGEGKDIMSVLLKANLGSSEDERLPDDEILAQMSSLIFAGTDTTSSALTQTLQLLAEHTDVQDKLRSELLSAAHGGDISYEVLSTLPNLDSICRETLRLYPPSTFVFREAIQSSMLPISEPVQGRDGHMISSIAVPKGTVVLINLRACNVNKSVWGEDALEWKPERWLSALPTTLTNARIPGVYSNIMTFTGGGRSCLGYRFSELEMKVVLSTLISNFKFSLTNREIFWGMAGVRYPTVGKDSLKASCPLEIERLVE